MTAGRTWLIRRLRAPRVGDPTRVQVAVGAGCALLSGLAVGSITVAVAGVGAPRSLALAALVLLGGAGVSLSRIPARWRREVSAGLAEERRALQQARIIPSVVRRTQRHWILVTGGMAAAMTVPVTLLLAYAVTRAGAEPGLWLVPIVGAGTVTGALVPAATTWWISRREIGCPDC